MDAELLYMSSSEISQSVKSTQLELAYERALREAERIYEEERVRALRVQLLLLEHDNDDLQEQAEKDDDERRHMDDVNEDLRAHLADVEADLQHTQMDLKARIRDLDHLRTEVNALNAASTDTTQLLTEKLALARELNIIKPELDHLKSQSSTSQKLLSEKLALQRDVSSLQVELETEKRAVQRIKAREESSSREDSALTAEVEALRKELTKAQRDVLKSSSAREGSLAEIDSLKKDLVRAQRDAQKQVSHDDSASSAEIETLRKDLTKAQRDGQKMEREIRKKVTEWETEKEVLEGKLDAFRNKLRSTKEQLNDAQQEIEKLQAAKMAQSAEMTKARITGTAAANPRKRNVARFDPDITIGTPGNGGPTSKKPRISVSVGEKSSFSITPFLNRTLSILPESPDDADEPQKKANKPGSQQVDGAGDEADPATRAKTSKAKQDKSATARKTTAPVPKAKALKPLKETTNAKANSTMKKPQLSQLLEEDSGMESDQDDGCQDGESANKENTDDTSSTTKNTAEPLVTQKPASKRTNIFDEENSAPAPKIRSLGGGGGLGRINLKAKPIGKGKTLAEFSPLKKDRRAASILE